MKGMLRLFALILVAILAIGSAVAFAESYPTKSPEEYSGELEIWCWGSYEERCTETFYDMYPNVKLNFVKVAQGDYITKVQTAVASQSDLPDIILLEQTPRLSEMDMNCWEVLDAPPYNLDKTQLVEWCWPLITNRNGEIVCVQFDNTIGGIAYNRANAQKYWGISEVDEMEAKFQTVDDYIEASEAFKDGDGSSFMFGSVYDAYFAFIGLYADEPLVNDDDTVNFDVNILPVLQTVEKMVANNAIGRLEAWTPAWSASFSTDYSTIFPAVTWMVYDNMVPNDPDAVDKWGLITPPGGGYSWGGTAFAIPKGISDERKELAWEFIRWFCLSDEGAQAFLDNNHAPTLYAPALESQAIQDFEDPAFGGQNTLQKYVEIGKHPNTKVRPMTVYDDAIQSILTGSIFNEIENGMSAEEAVEMLTDELINRYPQIKRK